MSRVEIFEDDVKELNRKKKIRVYLPSGYDESSSNAYRVLYMHDGANLYEDKDAAYGEAWRVSETLDYLIGENKIEPLIVVGIDNDSDHRFDEYSPWDFSGPEGFKGYDLENKGGEGVAYGKYIVERLKPLIDRKYRTKKEREYTGVAGSSMGGFISLYVGMEYSDVFSYIGAFSTASWFAEKELLDFIKNKDVKEQLYYLDTGTHELPKGMKNYYYEGLINIYDILLEKGINKENIKTVVDVGAIHNEKDWRVRFPEFIKWIL